MTDTATTPAQEQHQADAAAPQAARHRVRKPKSPEAQQRGTAKRKFMRAAAGLRDAAQLERAAEAIAALKKPQQEPEESESAEEPKKLAAPQAQVLTAAPAHVDTTKPGWPTNAAMADAAPTVKELVDVAAVFLTGTRFDILGTIEVRVGDKVLSRTKADVLAEKLTPLAAKYGVTLLDAPEAVAVAGLVAVFGQPLIAMAAAKMQLVGGVSGAPA